MNSVRPYERVIARRLQHLVALCVALIVLALGVLGLQARQLASPGVLEALRDNASLVADSVRVQLDRASDLNIPLTELPGLEASLQAELRRHADVAFLGVVDEHGTLLAWAAQPNHAQRAQAMLHAGAAAEGYWIGAAPGQAAQVRVGVANDFFDRSLRDMVLELLAAVVVALVLAAELARYVLAHRALGPLLRLHWVLQGLSIGRVDRRTQVGAQAQGLGAGVARRLDARLDQGAAEITAQPPSAALSAWRTRHWPGEVLAPAGHTVGVVRLGVFFIALAEELCRPFFIVFAQSVVGDSGVSPTVLAALPVGAFMLAWALAQPLGPVLLPRLGVRRGLWLGAGLTALGFGLTACAWAPWLLILSRVLTGLGYGLFLIIGQAAIVQSGRSDSRARDLAAIATAVVAAGICGPMLGGVIADKFGYQTAFWACAAVAGCAALVTAWGVSAARDGAAPARFEWAALGDICRSRRFMQLIVLSAVPTKFAATAMLVVLLPLFLHDQGETKMMIGRVLMLYFVAFVLVAPWAARLADGRVSRRTLVALGGAASGLAVCVAVWQQAAWAAALASALFGACQALISGPQLAWVTAIVQAERPTMRVEVGLGVFRLLERLGSVVAPLACGVIVAWAGVASALLSLGAALVVCSVLLLWLTPREAGGQ